ncbi:MAG: hypothetical protein CM15mP49_07640 [Actinomycetota bacterium]|nr:MAG: hypothetical protein CM15mP49_07640 [Actinomycetota bacterium]
MLNPNATYLRERNPIRNRDMILMYTDGLAEVRNGEIFSEKTESHNTSPRPWYGTRYISETLLESARTSEKRLKTTSHTRN